MAGKLPVNQQVPMVQVIKVDLRTIQPHPRGQVYQLHAPAYLALVVVQQVAAAVRGWNPNIERGKSLKLIGRLGEAVSLSLIHI